MNLLTSFDNYKNNIDLSKLFDNLTLNKTIDIANNISASGGKLYLVGGCVRDIFLDKTPCDYDFCITGISSEKFEELYPNAIKQGKSFPVYILNNCEFALARKEIKTGNRHSDFKFYTDSSLSIYDDLKRRDFTINSIAIDLLTKEIIDPFNGINDIKNRVLKVTSTAFSEDPLRVYRAARFAAQLNFNVDISTIKAMESMKKELNNLSAERVFAEFRKALISSNPTNFFNVLKHANCLDIHFKEISDLIGVEQPLKYHPEGDVYNHTMEVLERASLETNDELIRFGALVHDFGKAATPREKWPHHYNHEKLGAPIVKDFCHKLKMPITYLKAGCCACNEHMRAGIYDRLKPGTKVDLFERVYKNKALSLKGLEIIANSDKNTLKNGSPIYFAEIAEQVIKNVKFDNKEHTYTPEKIKSILKEKRIRYLLELEKQS